jgi:putative endonuclease
MLECVDGSLYTGITNNIEQRMAKHESGKGAKYVRAHLPFKLVYQEECATKSEALKREIEIKKMPRTAKQNLFLKSNHE